MILPSWLRSFSSPSLKDVGVVSDPSLDQPYLVRMLEALDACEDVPPAILALAASQASSSDEEGEHGRARRNR